MLFCANLHRATDDADVASVESRLVARIIVFGGEDERTAVDRDKSQLWRVLDVDEEAESARHADALAVDRRKQLAPGGVLRPQAAVAVSVALERHLTCSRYRNLKFGVFYV